MSEEVRKGFVYILSTREEKKFLKIGMTTRPVTDRVKEINAATGVLFPYSVRAVFKVTDAAKAEKMIHEKFANYRVRGDREFFEISFQMAQRIIKDYLRYENLLQK